MSLRDKLDNSPEEIEVEGFGRIKVRMPTIAERLAVKAEVKKLPGYEHLSEAERAEWEANLLALKCIVEPKLSLEDFLNAPDIVMYSLLSAVAKWWENRLNRVVSSDFLLRRKQA